MGSCVGIKGSRVQSIVRELNGERIDIVPWSTDPVVFVGRALSPAKVKEVHVAENGREMRVVVDDDQLSLAIGKGGQNARLAARLTGMKIDLMSEGEERRLTEVEQLMRLEVEHLPGVGEKVAESLIRAGIETAAELAAADLDQLVALPGIGEKTAEKLLAIGREAVAQRAVEVEAIMAERVAAARAAVAAAVAAEEAAVAAEESAASVEVEMVDAAGDEAAPADSDADSDSDSDSDSYMNSQSAAEADAPAPETAMPEAGPEPAADGEPDPGPR